MRLVYRAYTFHSELQTSKSEWIEALEDEDEDCNRDETDDEDVV